MKWILAGSVVASGATALLSGRAPRYSFRDKAVFITGASRGLGLWLAELLAEEGALLTLVSRNKESLQAARERFAGSGANVFTQTCDVRDPQQVQNAVEASVTHYGSIDVLINNAGVIQVGPLEEMRLADFELAMDTHAWGPLYTMFAALPHMRRQGTGRIVNISSIGGKIAVPHLLPYCMSKFALAGLSDGIRSELRKYGIYVTSIYPGLMRTGSHVFVNTKGNRSAEFRWFGFMATNPMFAIRARRAAKQIIAACRSGRAELVITTQANLAVMAQALVPEVVAGLSAIAESLLPQPTGPDERKAA